MAGTPSSGGEGVFAAIGATSVPVPWPGRVPVAPARVPTHAALPGHLALRHPVAAAPLAGQEEVTPDHRHHRPSSPSRFARSHAGTASAATGTPAPTLRASTGPRAAATHSWSRSSPGPGPASPGASPSLPQLKSHFRFSPAACALLPGEGSAAKRCGLATVTEWSPPVPAWSPPMAGGGRGRPVPRPGLSPGPSLSPRKGAMPTVRVPPGPVLEAAVGKPQGSPGPP